MDERGGLTLRISGRLERPSGGSGRRCYLCSLTQSWPTAYYRPVPASYSDSSCVAATQCDLASVAAQGADVRQLKGAFERAALGASRAAHSVAAHSAHCVRMRPPSLSLPPTRHSQVRGPGHPSVSRHVVSAVIVAYSLRPPDPHARIVHVFDGLWCRP